MSSPTRRDNHYADIAGAAAASDAGRLQTRCAGQSHRNHQAASPTSGVQPTIAIPTLYE